MADKERDDRIDPTWPSWSTDDHPVSELASSVQGASSPYGELEFPSQDVPYVHPETEINR